MGMFTWLFSSVEKDAIEEARKLIEQQKKETQALWERIDQLELLLLGIHDNFSDPPVPEEHIQRMLKRIENLVPDSFKDIKSQLPND